MLLFAFRLSGLSRLRVSVLSSTPCLGVIDSLLLSLLTEMNILNYLGIFGFISTLSSFEIIIF